jgi:NhaP-type Na+/H+ and K+/H+ antiporter
MRNILSRAQFGLFVGPLVMVVVISSLQKFLFLHPVTVFFIILTSALFQLITIRYFAKSWKLNYEARYSTAERKYFFERSREVNYAGAEYENLQSEYAEKYKHDTTCINALLLNLRIERYSDYIDSVERKTFEQHGIPKHLQLEKALIEVFI